MHLSSSINMKPKMSNSTMYRRILILSAMCHLTILAVDVARRNLNANELLGGHLGAATNSIINTVEVDSLGSSSEIPRPPYGGVDPNKVQWLPMRDKPISADVLIAGSSYPEIVMK